jgi:hypothetical protein
LETMYPDWDAYNEPEGPLAMKASADPDTMYHHEAMREPDRDEFKKAMQKEIDDQMENGNFEIIKRREVPKGATILPAVWQMKRKHDIHEERNSLRPDICSSSLMEFDSHSIRINCG